MSYCLLTPEICPLPAGLGQWERFLQAGQQWLAVGDAAASYDPLSAQGIIKAISNGIFAGRAIIESGMSHVCSFL